MKKKGKNSLQYEADTLVFSIPGFPFQRKQSNVGKKFLFFSQVELNKMKFISFFLAFNTKKCFLDISFGFLRLSIVDLFVDVNLKVP